MAGGAGACAAVTSPTERGGQGLRGACGCPRVQDGLDVGYGGGKRAEGDAPSRPRIPRTRKRGRERGLGVGAAAACRSHRIPSRSLLRPPQPARGQPWTPRRPSPASRPAQTLAAAPLQPVPARAAPHRRVARRGRVAGLGRPLLGEARSAASCGPRVGPGVPSCRDQSHAEPWEDPMRVGETCECRLALGGKGFVVHPRRPGQADLRVPSRWGRLPSSSSVPSTLGVRRWRSKLGPSSSSSGHVAIATARQTSKATRSPVGWARSTRASGERWQRREPLRGSRCCAANKAIARVSWGGFRQQRFILS